MAQEEKPAGDPIVLRLRMKNKIPEGEIMIGSLTRGTHEAAGGRPNRCEGDESPIGRPGVTPLASRKKISCLAKQIRPRWFHSKSESRCNPSKERKH